MEFSLTLHYSVSCITKELVTFVEKGIWVVLIEYVGRLCFVYVTSSLRFVDNLHLCSPCACKMFMLHSTVLELGLDSFCIDGALDHILMPSLPVLSC